MHVSGISQWSEGSQVPIRTPSLCCFFALMSLFNFQQSYYLCERCCLRPQASTTVADCLRSSHAPMHAMVNTLVRKPSCTIHSVQFCGFQCIHSCVPITTINFKHFQNPKIKCGTHQQSFHIPPPTSTALTQVLMHFLFLWFSLDISYKWNYKIGDLLWLPYFI